MTSPVRSAERAPLAQRLERVDILSGLGERGLAALLPMIRVRHYESEQTIVGRLDPGRDVFFVLSGKVRVTTFAESGREVAFRDLGPGSSFGEIAAIDGEPRSADVVALEDSLLGSMTAQEFWALLQREPAVMKATLVKLARLVRALSQRVHEFASPVPARICAEYLRLARLAATPGAPLRIAPPPKHADIAATVVTHREAVSRVQSELARRGVLAKGRGELVIKDPAALERYAQGVERLLD
ncbi:MAG: Crp/Fnr family transcriptional regulator [Geminicoccaceae bacterium]|nr:Crp/Fnr family transcriptional regulator [Geminicoccaceae bacterium]MCX8100289.1 Crp/Fnr family transcriptional regulator [Geminicoccaceae bacterium]MDW8370327.1 Crp/Fnr family transcriptional regulator [Geminicoccaceae bacterium]